ncbi:adenosine deaminase [Acetobacter malorum]|uniref:adenosine deaminase n=1 Tax=Acetobacter malorum TaxID=178901 RepID=UPI0039EC52D9
MHRQDFITEIPKAELHLHIEGSLEPELMFALARRNRVSIPFSSIEDVRQAYQFTKLQDFLDIYYAGADVLLTAEDFRDLAVAYFDRAAADGVTHAEIFFDPQTHTQRGVPFDVVMEGLLAGVEEARRRHGMSVLLILCFLRHLDEDSAFATFRSAEKWFGQISGVGLDSSEVGHPPSKFAKVFAAAADAGLKRVAHAGEEGPPAYVYEALDILRVDRLDHGNRSLEDPLLTSRLARDAMTLTVCPLSNLKLCVVEDLRNHPIDIMLEKGLRATLNSDDPAYFGGYVAENYRALVDAGKLSNRDVATLARNSFLGSFLNDEALTHQLERLDAFLLRHTAAL